MHPKQAARRRHGAELKTRVLAACNQPGASVAAVARAYELNANLVHKWRRRGAVQPMQPPPAKPLKGAASEFVALALPSPPVAAPTPPLATPATIRIELKRGATRVGVSWPAAAAAECAAWLRELLR